VTYRGAVHRSLLAVAAGLALWLAFPSPGLWWLAPVGVGALAVATSGAGARHGFLLGLLTGLGCFLPLLAWSGTYVGALPWVALSVFEALYVALLGAASAYLQRRSVQPDDTPAAASLAPRIRPVAVALLWVAQEALRGRAPFGGFPWGRLAFSQADSPLVRLAALGGAPLVTFAVALTGAFGALGALDLLRAIRGFGDVREIRRGSRRDAYRAVLPVFAPVLGLVAVLATPALIPLPTSDGPQRAGRVAQVMAVQGNVPRAGLDFNAQRRAVLDDHVAVTNAGASAVAAGTRAAPDLVLWPENSSDIDPLINTDAATRIQQAADRVRVPILLGAVLEQPKPRISNASLLWAPGPHGGVVQRYVKRHPVPFAEYIPLRSFFRLFSSKVDLVRNDFAAGSSVGVFHVPTRSGGTLAAGAVICFEVAYDDLVRDTVSAGANLIVVQTNNATFGYTDESVQQLAISRLRAVEHGRSVVHVSTVGVSALITPDGRAHQSSTLFTSALLSGALPLRSQQTLADRTGGWPELAACGAVLLLLIRRPAFSRAGPLRSTGVPARGAATDEHQSTGRTGRRADSDVQRTREPAADRRATSSQRPGS
jgi:apolipoprotein N-acyltransferase